MSIFIDTNIWLYALIGSNDPAKMMRARERLKSLETATISHQVIVEIANNLLRKANLTEPAVRNCLAGIYANCDVVPVGRETVFKASEMREKDTLSYWDSLIIAAALETGCTECWSEDLQTGRLFEGQLRIVNPLAD